MVSIVRAATCGRALSWRNDTDICALFLLFLMFLSSIEVVFWWLLSHYHHWCSVFQTIRGQLFACSPEWVHRRGYCSQLYGSPQPALMRFILHRFPSFFKRTALLIDTNIWQCLLTILPLQSWTDFRRFTTFFCQEFGYNALFHAKVYPRFAHLSHNWQNCVVANTRSVNYLGTVLPPSTYYCFQWTSLHFWTTNKL